MREKSSPTPRDLSKKDHGDCGANLFLTLKNEDGSVLAKQNLFGTYRLERDNLEVFFQCVVM